MGKKLVIIETKKKVFTRALLSIRDDVLPLSYEQGTMKINFLESPSPHVLQETWHQTYSSIFCQSQDIPPASGTSHFINSNLSELRNISGNRKVNLLDLRDLIKEKKINKFSPEFRYWEVANNRLQDICGILKNSIDVSVGYDFAQLIKSRYIKVLECSERPDLFDLEATDFIFRTLKYQETLPPQERDEIIFVLDEAHHIAGPEKEHMGRVGALSNLFSYMANGREYKVSFWLVSQDIKRIHGSVPSLCHVNAMFCCDGETYQRMGVNIMGLSYDQKNWLLEHGLEPRMAVVKTDLHPPVLIKTPDISHLFRNVNYEEAQKRIEGYLKEFVWKPRDPEILRLISAKSGKQSNQDKNSLLRRVCLRPRDTKGEHQKGLGLNNTSFKNLVEEAMIQGLLREETIQTGEPGRQPILLDLTDRGREEVKKLGLNPPDTGKGGLRHFEYCVRIEGILKSQGYQTKREYFFAGPALSVDILGWKESETIAIEVELSSAEHLINRLMTLIDTNLCQKIMAFSDDRELIGKVRRLILKSRPNSKYIAEFRLAQEFFRERRKA